MIFDKQISYALIYAPHKGIWDMYYNNISEVKKLSNDEVVKFAPSVLTLEGADNTSKQYSPISTMDIIDILSLDEWYVTQAVEVKCRNTDNRGYQKHMLKFQNKDLMLGEENLQAVLTNSHDGKSSYKFMLGIYRLICSNGLVVGDTFEELCVRHVGLKQDMVINASQKLLEFAPNLATNINQFKQIELSPREQEIYAGSAKMILLPKKEDYDASQLTPERLLRARRYDDRKNNSLWHIYNRVQENVIKGGIKTVHYEGYKRKTKTSRRVKAIDKNIKLNRALWNLTEEMKKIKTIVN